MCKSVQECARNRSTVKFVHGFAALEGQGWQFPTSFVARWQSCHREKVTDPSAEIKPQWGRVVMGLGQTSPRLGYLDRPNRPKTNQ